MDEPAFERARAHFAAGLQQLQAGRLAEAEASFAQSLALLPGRPSTLTNLGAVRLQLGRAADAVPLLQQAALAEPDNFEAWAHLGVAHLRLAQDEAALQAIERALALRPEHAPLRLEAATALARLRRFEPALAQVQQLLAQQPRHAAAWTLRGNLLRDLGRAHAAAAAYEQALACGGDAGLNRFLLAGLQRGEPAPARAPDAYVRGLFDDYAEDFDQHLVQVLHYRGHEHVAALLRRTGQRLQAVLDLGCGTGLLAPLLTPLLAAPGGRIDGVDLSPAMVERARARGGYTQLAAADLVAHLQATAQRYDAVVAADVFIYVGALDAVFAGVARVLAAGGWFAFSVEQADDAHALLLQPSLRYAHGEPALRALATQHGFDVRAVEAGPIREEQRVPIDGLYWLLQRR